MAQVSAKNLERTKPAKKERVASMPQREQLTTTPESPLPKGKKWSHLFRSPDREESQDERESHLGKREGIKAGAWKRKKEPHSEESQVLRTRGRASKESLSRTSRRKHERLSGCNSYPGRSAESWLYSKYRQT